MLKPQFNWSGIGREQPDLMCPDGMKSVQIAKMRGWFQQLQHVKSHKFSRLSKLSRESRSNLPLAPHFQLVSLIHHRKPFKENNTHARSSTGIRDCLEKAYHHLLHFLQWPFWSVCINMSIYIYIQTIIYICIYKHLWPNSISSIHPLKTLITISIQIILYLKDPIGFPIAKYPPFSMVFGSRWRVARLVSTVSRPSLSPGPQRWLRNSGQRFSGRAWQLRRVSLFVILRYWNVWYMCT